MLFRQGPELGDVVGVGEPAGVTFVESRPIVPLLVVKPTKAVLPPSSTGLS